MSTMMTFEYLNQLCQNKEQICSLPAAYRGVQGNRTAFHNKTLVYLGNWIYIAHFGQEANSRGQIHVENKKIQTDHY